METGQKDRTLGFLEIHAGILVSPKGRGKGDGTFKRWDLEQGDEAQGFFGVSQLSAEEAVVK